MENVNAEHAQNEHQADSAVKVIWRTFWILLGITLVELTLGMFVAPHYHEYKHVFNGVYVILTLAKAFYIVAEFMHLRHEIKNLIMTWRGVFEKRGHYLMIEKAGLYWHFVDLVWVFVSTCFYLF